MNRSKTMIAALVFSVCLSLAGTAWAVPFTFEEVFLGDRNDGLGYSMAEKKFAQNYPLGVGNKARFNFDLTGSGGTGQLLVGKNSVSSPVMPTLDEHDFDSTLHSAPHSAYIDFFIYDWVFEQPKTANPQPPFKERVKIDIESGTYKKTRTFTLENDSNGWKKVHVDLAQEGLLDLLVDGELMAMAISPAFGPAVDVYNSFYLDRVVLHAEANSVPEPATMLLLGGGLMGLAFAQKRKIRNT